MALICDPDYLIHSLRLNYLRHGDDLYGPRIITFDPRYQSNSHITASGAADYDRWPELNMPQSPQVSDDEGDSRPPASRRAHTGFPGATGLKYTQTIMGPSRVGSAGMRVTGRRPMPGKDIARRSISATSSTPRRSRADSEPTPTATTSSPNGNEAAGSPDTYNDIQVSKRRSAGGSSLSEIATTLIEKPDMMENKSESHSLNNVPMALQSMSNITAIQARRQRRRAHFTSGDDTNRPIIISETRLNPEDSSSDDEGEQLSGSMLDDDYIVEVEGSLDVENDEFDPDFAPPRIGFNSDSSDLLNSISNSAISTSVSSAYNSSLQVGGSARAGRGKLSPVSETRPSDYSPGRNAASSSGDGGASDTTAQRNAGTPIDDYFEIVNPPAPGGRPSEPFKPNNQEIPSRRVQLSDKPAVSHPLEEPLFTRRKVPPARTATSALSAKLASSDTSTNPFSELYALISGRSEVASMDVTVFFPHATKPANKPMKLTVRKDATFEEVVGFSLWSYWEEGWLPKLDEGLSEEQKKEKLSAVGWVIRIAEDDGEVDEDFPAPDRMGKISKFNFDAYAILEANPAQVARNAQQEATIVRRPSRIIISKKKPEPTTGLAPPAPMLGPSISSLSASALGTSVGLLGSSLGISSSHGAQVLLRIRMADVDDKVVHYSTTISVYSTMYMQEVLEHICRKRKLDNPKDWALLADDLKILVPLDRTVASLEGNAQLVLIQRALLPDYGFAIDGDRRTARSIDPNASIFKRISEVQPKSKATDSNFDVYKRYTVYRKVAMLVGRLERILAIDGDYIHIMPSAHKARVVFDSKTVSYHIKSVTSCSQSTKTSISFKLVFRREGGDKRYDFEAESPRLATEIVSIVRGMRLKAGLERTSTGHKIRRRSRQVT